MEREKAFHDDIFEHGTRAATGVEAFYERSTSTKTFYKEFLQAHCRGKRVLEYGCGADGYSIFLAKAGATVTAIDISEVAIRHSREQAERDGIDGVGYHVMDAEALGFPDNSFDLICGTAILHHLDYCKALSEIVRTLRPDGTALFVECLGHNPVIQLYRWLTPQLRSADEHPLISSDLARACSYFGNVELHYFYLFSIAAVPFQRLWGSRYLLWALERFDRAVLKLFPFMKMYCWTVIMILSRPTKRVKLSDSAKGRSDCD
jgi:SAM-dependent methyltransferase